MSKRKNTLSPGRRQVVLGLTSLMGIALTGCSFDNPASTSQGPATTTRTTTPGVTPTAGPDQGTTLYTYKGHSAIVNDLAWSPDSKSIASQDFTKLWVWDVTTGEESFIHQTNHTNELATLAWSPDGTGIAIPDNPFMATSAVLILNAQTGKTLVTCSISNVTQVANDYYIFQITWSPDSNRIAVAGDTDVKICDASTGQHILTYPAVQPTSGRQPSYAVAWSPDGNTIASAAANQGHSIQFWNAHSGQPLHYLPGEWPLALAWSPDGKFIALRNGSAVQIQYVNTNQMLFSVQAGVPVVLDEVRRSPYSGVHPHTITWSPDGKFIALADGQKQVQIWNVASQSLSYTYSGHSDVVLAVGWSPDGSRIASAGVDQTVRVWQAL